MYSVLSYGHMAADGVRMDAYARAIEHTVKPGDIVLDLGAGTGIMSILAARAGAKRVHAVDLNPAVWLTRDLAMENGVADRIQVHCTSSLELTLPEKVDVIISDLRGSVPLHDDHLSIVHDAKSRLLKPNGILLPERDRLFVAMVDSSQLAQNLEQATVGFSLRNVHTAASITSMLNTTHRDAGTTLFASDILSSSVEWGVIDYATPPKDVVESTVEVVVRRRGRVNALAIRFEASIHGDIGYSTAPGSMTAYARILLPLLTPIEVERDDRARLTIRANANGDRWAWETDHLRDGVAQKRFRQATFLGMPTSPETLLRSSTTHRPVRASQGERVKRILELFDGSQSVADIADIVTKESGLPRALVLDEVRNAVSRYGR